MRKLILLALGLILAPTRAVWADAIQLSLAASLSAGDATLEFSGTIGGVISSPVSYSVGGNTLSFTASGGRFEVDQVGKTYFGSAFSNGTTILFGAGFQGPSAPLTINFATPVREVGFNAEEFGVGDAVFTFSAFDGSALLGTFTANGNDPKLLSFEGVKARDGSVITSLVLSDNGRNNIAAGPMTFASAVPEPGTLSLLAIGLAGLGFARRRRSL